MITRRLFHGGLLASFMGLLFPGQSKANDATIDIKLGDILQVDGLKYHDSPFEGVVVEIMTKENIKPYPWSTEKFTLYSLIAVDCFPPKPPRSMAYPGYHNSAGIHFRSKRGWTNGTDSAPISVSLVCQDS